MFLFSVICSEISSILLFFYAIHRFSKMIMRMNIHRLKHFIEKITNNTLKTFSLGVGCSCLMQSNKAASSIALTLINAGAISCYSALPILFGTLIGTASVSFLVSIKANLIFEILIISGCVLKKTKSKTIGNVLFYLGLLLLSLNLMTQSTMVLKDEVWFKNIFLFTNNIMILFLIGTLLSFLLQSGALILSIITILYSFGTICLYNALIISVGITLGSTLSLIIVVFSMNDEAKKACYIHIFFVAICSLFTLTLVDNILETGINFSNKSIHFGIMNLIIRTIISLSGIFLTFLVVKQPKFIKNIICYVKNKSLKIREQYNTNITSCKPNKI